MQPAAQVQAAIELLSESLQSDLRADRLLSNYFRQRRYIGSKDKRAIATHFYQVVRQRRALEALLDQYQLPTNPASLMAANLSLDGANLAKVFTGARHQPAKLPEAERYTELSAEALEQLPDEVRLNVPDWLAEELRQSLGESFIAEMELASLRAPLDLRVNTLKSDRASVLEELENLGIKCSVGKLSPWAITVHQALSLNELELYKQGVIEVQDQGSQVLACLAGAKAGERVVDFCAGAGGKSLAMAQMMDNKGVIYACDVHDKRLDNLGKRARRAGVHNIRSKVLSSERDKWVKQHSGYADLVLVDAPCSGTGTWRRNPDSRWNLSSDDLDELQTLQASILDSASRLVKPGGRIIYATCSFLQRENEDQVANFLKHHPEFASIELTLQNSEDVLIESPTVRLLSSVHETDGFFAAGFTRNKD